MARTKQTAGKSTGGKAPKIASNADLEREDDKVANIMGNRPSTEEQIIVMKSQAAHPNEGHASKRQRLSSSPENHDDNLVVTGSSTTTSLLSSPSLLNDNGRVTTASSMSLAIAANEEEVVTISAPGKVLTAGNNGDEYSGKWTNNRLVMAVTSDDVSNPTLPTMPTAVLLNILKYVDGDHYRRHKSMRCRHYRPDILAFERTCRTFRHLLKDDAIWGTLFPDEYIGKDFDHPPTMREKAFLGVSLLEILSQQKRDDNILLEYLGGAVGVRRIVGLLLDEMKPVEVLPPLFLRGDAIMYLVEVIQGYMIDRLRKVMLLVIGNLRPGDGYPEVRKKVLCLLDELTLYSGSFRHHSSLGVIECNFLEHCRCSIAKNKHSCTRMCRPSIAGEYAKWTWPDHNCASEEILGAEERRKMVRALAYRAGIVKMSGSAFSIVSTEILHHMAVIVSYAYDTFVSDPPVMLLEEGDDSNADYDSDQSEDVHLEKRIQRGLNYYARFHPPGQTGLIVIPRQIRDAAVMIGMKPLLGFGVFGDEWAASNDDDRQEEVENVEDQYYPEEEIESEEERVDGGDEAPGPVEQPIPDPDVDDESVLSLLSDSFSLDG